MPACELSTVEAVCHSKQVTTGCNLESVVSTVLAAPQSTWIFLICRKKHCRQTQLPARTSAPQSAVLPPLSGTLSLPGSPSSSAGSALRLRVLPTGGSVLCSLPGAGANLELLHVYRARTITLSCRHCHRPCFTSAADTASPTLQESDANGPFSPSYACSKAGYLASLGVVRVTAANARICLHRGSNSPSHRLCEGHAPGHAQSPQLPARSLPPRPWHPPAGGL